MRSFEDLQNKNLVFKRPTLEEMLQALRDSIKDDDGELGIEVEETDSPISPELSPVESEMKT